MNFAPFASIKLSDVLSSKPAGETVNSHVFDAAREPEPDFAAMQRMITGDESKATAGNKIVSREE
jgi:hypothetical protein